MIENQKQKNPMLCSVPWGKHRGKVVADVIHDSDYWEWITSTTNYKFYVAVYLAGKQFIEQQRQERVEQEQSFQEMRNGHSR